MGIAGSVMKVTGSPDKYANGLTPTAGLPQLETSVCVPQEPSMSREPEDPQQNVTESHVGHSPEPPSGDIVILCPRKNIPVPTGLKVAWVVFKSLPPVAVPLHCPACGHVHRWRPKDAWIDPGQELREPNL